MKKMVTHENYAEMSWHDAALYGISWKVDSESAISDLILEIDYICEWLCGSDKKCTFKVAPATLVFHNITDLKLRLNIDWGCSGFQSCLEGGISIMVIQREPIENQKVYLGKPYYKWVIAFSPPTQDSSISFGASGYTQTLRKEPILLERQNLTLTERQ